MNSKNLSVEEMKERFLKGYSADLYDTLDKMGYGNQCMSLAIKPLREDMKICGPAFTVYGTREPRFDNDLPSPKFDNFAHFDIMYKNCVIVMNSEKDEICGHWGEMMSYGARAAGASGVVIDGGTRDKTGILRINNWSCFARYTSPVESKQRWRAKDLECPIYVSGTLTANILVRPGDWIFGDSDGVIVIPKEILYDALIGMEEIIQKENLSRDAFNDGDDILTVFNKFNRA
ncbi:MAG: RraA family protein [Oscillospiraceae bacterium]|nr:RraA family protein [Oscillospiraceae bacterium]